MFTVYILYSQKLDKYYIGFSSDVNVRLLKHNRSNKGFSSLGKPWVIVHTELFPDKSQAMAREKQLKKWKNRDRIISLINSGSEHLD
jgi:putative endonuclease